MYYVAVVIACEYSRTKQVAYFHLDAMPPYKCSSGSGIPTGLITPNFKM